MEDGPTIFVLVKTLCWSGSITGSVIAHSIYSSISKLRREKTGKLAYKYTFGKRSYSPPSSMQRYFKKQSGRGPSINCPVLTCYLKVINPDTLLWYNGTSTIVLEPWWGTCCWPVTVIRRLPFTLLFLMNYYLVFRQRLITSALGLMHLTLPMM